MRQSKKNIFTLLLTPELPTPIRTEQNRAETDREYIINQIARHVWLTDAEPWSVFGLMKLSRLNGKRRLSAYIINTRPSLFLEECRRETSWRHSTILETGPE